MILTLVNWLEMGFYGVCLATSLQFLCRFAVANVYLCFVKPHQDAREVRLFSRESMSHLGPQFSKGVMSLLMGVWGWWAFDFFTLIASYLSSEVISA